MYLFTAEISKRREHALKDINEKINKLTDKAFSRLVIMSILGIAICIICLCTSTWAWFSESLPSNNNTIVSASDCLISVSLTKDGTEIASADIDNVPTVELEAGETYTVTVSLSKDSSSGYLVISDADGIEYRTEYISRHNDEVPKVISFTLSVEETQNLTFTTKWGIYSGESDVLDNGILNIQ